MTNKLRYSEFEQYIDIDAFEEAIGFYPEKQTEDEDSGYCLFPDNHSHGDSTGKFSINRDKRVYNCWVCGGGSLLSLVMELYSWDIEEATRWIHQFTEDIRTDTEFLDEFLAGFDDAIERATSLPYFNDRVLDQYRGKTYRELEEWLDSKGILWEVAENYGVCYSPEMRRPGPKTKKFAGADDYYGPAIIFPHYWQERLVGWQCRWLDDYRPEWVPKYTMTSDFPKENTLYGWDHLDRESVVVVESVPTVLFLASLGIPAVATFGSSVNEPQLRLLRRIPKVFLAPDNDYAGDKWTNQISLYLKNYTRVWVAPKVDGAPGTDYGDLVNEAYPDISVDEYLENAIEVGTL